MESHCDLRAERAQQPVLRVLEQLEQELRDLEVNLGRSANPLDYRLDTRMLPAAATTSVVLFVRGRVTVSWNCCPLNSIQVA